MVKPNISNSFSSREQKTPTGPGSTTFLGGISYLESERLKQSAALISVYNLNLSGTILKVVILQFCIKQAQCRKKKNVV